ncbi:hypothetical protein ACFFMN_22895 [Planobispora siamensis]|nr:hypothetical protein [Planobispora siamensis]
MGEVISIGRARQARVERRLALAEHAVMHPSLRWVTGNDDQVAHRRHSDGGTICGAAGPLLLAPTGANRCPHCYSLPGTG